MMNEFKHRLIHLHHCRGVNWNSIWTILKKDPDLHRLYQNEIETQLLSPAIKNTLKDDLQSQRIRNTINEYEKKDIRTITIFEPEYPPMLLETYKPPWVLYAKGNPSLLTRDHLLAVVGSRKATTFGKKSIELLFPQLIEERIVIVSGLAAGIDTHAHRMTIGLGGYTIGVIAGGFDHLYPKENIQLAHEMMKNHLVISEYPPNIRPQKWHFPMRNRIIAGISKGTLVVEAKKSSGSLITANYAVHEGREVFAVPGHILNSCSVGTNELIKQGAKLVLTPDDILEELI
jgi:DNA processing protein